MKKVKNISSWDIKDKVKLIAGTVTENDDKSGFNYFTDLLPFYFSDDKDLPVITEKMDNLICLLKKTKDSGPVEFEKFQDMDFEDEIWNLI